MSESKLLQPLSPHPVAGVSFANVWVFRLDKVSAVAPGNKRFKIEGWIESLQERPKQVLSFGGAWSNHLHALAHWGKVHGIATVGVVRGEQQTQLTATLRDCQRWGMQLEFVSRSDYRRRHAPDFQRELHRRFPGAAILPEGGAGAAGVVGCAGIADLLLAEALPTGPVLVGVGTGTTLAGLALGFGQASQLDREIIGVSALRGATNLDEQVATELARWDKVARWRILHDHHCGGFARVSSGLRAFIQDFEAIQGVPLDPVYSGKVMYAIHQLRASGTWDCDQALTVIHTGGLQGRRGFPWLSP